MADVDENERPEAEAGHVAVLLAQHRLSESGRQGEREKEREQGRREKNWRSGSVGNAICQQLFYGMSIDHGN